MLADRKSAAYESQVSSLLDEEERAAREFYLGCTPEQHPVIPGSGGFRKCPWARRGKGKSGGFRVIYYFVVEPGRIYLASIYAKSAKQTLSAADKAVLAKLEGEIKGATRRGRS